MMKFFAIQTCNPMEKIETLKRSGLSNQVLNDLLEIKESDLKKLESFMTKIHSSER